MFCTSCGIKNAADSNFCKQCGAKLDRAAAVKISEDAFERALPDDEQAGALLERAYRLRKENNLEGAIALCQEILRLPGDSTSAHSLLGQLYEQQGDRDAAIREYERVLHLNPGSIADRVKLDELRGQDGNENVPGSTRKAHPRVVMADPQTIPGLGYARFTSAGVAAALLVLGGLVALQFRPHSAASNSAVADSTLNRTMVGNGKPDASQAATTGTANNGAGASALVTGTTGSTPADKSTGTTGSVPGPAAPNNTRANTPGANPIASSAPSTANANTPASAQPTIVYKYVQVPAPPASNAGSVSRLPGIKPPKFAANNSNSGNNGSGRVVLNGDPDVTENNDKITVKVNPNDVGGKKNDGSGEGNGFSRIILDKTSSGAVKTAPAPGPGTTIEARSFVALGDEKKRQRDYKGAIDAFTKAIASAGDQMGYVLQQRALCFQQLNELASAKSDYERAINEYRKLEARDPETARNGVRACEKGIKLCGE